MSDPPESTYVPGRCNTPPANVPTRRTGLSMSDFLYSGALEGVTSALLLIDGGIPRSFVARIVTRLREDRLRFIKKIPLDLKSDICSPRDRRAALAVYDEVIETMDSTNHLEIDMVADAKIKVILGIGRANPDHPVFEKEFLSPIDPAYAEPRIEASEDRLGYHASWRLQEWRRDGWPGSYLGRAIEKEKTMKGDPSTWRDQNWSDEPSKDWLDLGGKVI